MYTWSMNSIVRSMMLPTRFSRSMLTAPTAPTSFRLIGDGTPPTSQFGCGLRPPNTAWIFTISFWKSSASR